MPDERIQHVTIRLARGYQFIAEFNDVPTKPAILLDEPAPLGDDRAPNASAVLGAAVGNCLAASLAFCLRKARIEIEELTARVTTHVVRNERGRFRISGIDVDLAPVVASADRARAARCQELFEDFCTVTASVREGIPVSVSVNQPETVFSGCSAA
jgi:organic hydroperoxide reductase OsmC/OhrA